MSTALWRRLGAMSVALVAAAALAACSTSSPSSAPATDATIKPQPSSGGDGGVDASNQTLPATWPAEVPVVDGAIITSLAALQGSSQTWSAQIAVPEAAAGFEQAKAAMVAAGFALDFEGQANGAYTAGLSNAAYTVTLVADRTDEDVPFVQYLVIRK